MSVEAIFDAFHKCAEALHSEDQRRRKVAVLMARSAKVCGTCYYWMKTRDCPLEGKQRGFPHMNYPACGKYEATTDAVNALAELRSPAPTKAEP